MASKASLEGMNAVTSGRTSTASTRSVAKRAPAAEVSPNATAVVEMLTGGMRKLSIIWMIPPVNATSALVTVEFDNNPVKKVTFPSAATASTTCPSVTLVKAVLVR